MEESDRTDEGDVERPNRPDENELDRAREALHEADEYATDRVQEQLESIEEGVFEEEAGDKTQDEPGPKVDRLAEVARKLDELADETAERATSEHLLAARDHVRAYLKDHPQGG